MKTTTCLKKMIEEKEILKMPCAHDALSACIAEKTGFSAICVGGYGASASLLGKPDVALMTVTEMVNHVARICECVNIPVFADGDTGHGNTTNVARTVKTFEKAGAAGLFIEDQVFPKRCGHMDGKDVIQREEMLAKIKAALDARTDPDFIIMGRTDALAVHGLDEAVERGVMMQEAGADMIFVEAPRTIEDMQRINKEIKCPTFAVYLEHGKIPMLSARQFEDLGFNVVAYGCSSVYSAAFALQETFREIFNTGETKETVNRMITFNDFNELIGLSDIRELEKKYAKE